MTRLATLREVAEDVRRNAHQSVTYDHNALLKLRAGDTDYKFDELTVDESEQVTLEQMDERLVEASVAGAVLELMALIGCGYTPT